MINYLELTCIVNISSPPSLGGVRGGHIGTKIYPNFSPNKRRLILNLNKSKKEKWKNGLLKRIGPDKCGDW